MESALYGIYALVFAFLLRSVFNSFSNTSTTRAEISMFSKFACMSSSSKGTYK